MIKIISVICNYVKYLREHVIAMSEKLVRIPKLLMKF